MNVRGVGLYQQTAGISSRKIGTEAKKPGLRKEQVQNEKKQTSFTDKVTISKEGKEAQKNMLIQNRKGAGPLAKIQSRQNLQQGMKTRSRSASPPAAGLARKDAL